MLGSLLTFLEDIIPEGIPYIDRRPAGLYAVKTDKSKPEYSPDKTVTKTEDIREFSHAVSQQDKEQIFLANIMLRQHILKLEQALYDIMVTQEADEEEIRKLIQQEEPIQFEMF